MRVKTLICSAGLLALLASGAQAQNKLTAFSATALTGETVTEKTILGRPSILIVTPSRDAAEETRQWALALRKQLDLSKIMVHDILAIDLPFFMSEQEALARARETIPQRYHDQTYLLPEIYLETSLYIPPASNIPYVFVLNAAGRVMVRVSGAPTTEHLNAVQNAVKGLVP